jgi:hypothetical protein
MDSTFRKAISVRGDGKNWQLPDEKEFQLKLLGTRVLEKGGGV